MQTRLGPLAVAATTLTFAAGLAAPIRAQAVVFELTEPTPRGTFGTRVAVLGDVDGDAVSDLLVGAPAESEFANVPGEVFVLSGRDGSRLYRVTGPANRGMFGTALASVGDLDGDGADDFAVGAYRDNSVSVHSGRDGTLLHRWTGSYGDAFGWSVAGAGDVDADGRPDVIVGARFMDFSNGRAFVFSGRTFQQLYEIRPIGAPSVAGRAALCGDTVCGVGDVNGDWHDDFVVSAPYEDYVSLNSGAVRVYSGLDGTVLRTFTGTFLSYGKGLAVAGDVNADGTKDLVVSLGNDHVVVHSLADGAVLHDFPFQFAGPVAGAGDVDGDGFDDFTMRKATWGPFLQVRSGRTGALLFEDTGPVESTASFPDLNGDGRDELLLGGDNVLRVLLMGCPPPATVCDGTPNGRGCTPRLETRGAASLSVGDGLEVSVVDVQDGVAGLALWSTSAGSTPLFGGTLCVGAPWRRVGAGFATPNPTSYLHAHGCRGIRSVRFGRAELQAAGLAPGMRAVVQFLARDPARAGFGAGLSPALEFTVCD